MASIVAYIEVREGIVTAPTRFLLAEARRVGDHAGATVYALLALGPLEHDRIEQIAEQVSAAGADRVLCSTSDHLACPPLDATHGPLLAQVAEHLRPVLFLFPAGGVGAELGPPLAVRIGAAYVANANVELRAEKSDLGSASLRVILTRWRTAHDGRRKIDVGDLERPVVAILASGTACRPLGEPCADVEMLSCPEPRFPELRVIASEALPDSAIELCSAVIRVPGAASASALAELQSALPMGTALVTTTNAQLGAFQVARPREVVCVSPVQDIEGAWPACVPGCVATRVGVEPDAASSAPDHAVAALAAALRRARSRAEGAE